MELEFLRRFQTGVERFDTDLRDLEVIQTPAGSWLYASTGLAGGICQYQLGGPPSSAGLSWHQNASLGTGEFALVERGGAAHLLQQGSGGAGLLSYVVGGDGGLGAQQQQALPGAGPSGIDLVLGGCTASGQEVIYALSDAGALTGWRLDAQGSPSAAVALGGAAEAFALPQAAALALSAAAGLLFVADGAIQGLRSYRVDARTGALTAADHFGAGDGLPVSGPTAIKSFQAFGAEWLLLAAAGSGSLSLLQVSAAGEFTLMDHLNDSLSSRFGGATLIEVVVQGDHVLVLAAGADDGLSLLRLLPSGQLVHVSSLADAPGLGLENATALAVARFGDQLEIYVSSATAPGLSQLQLDLGALGQVAEVQSGALSGGRGDDLLQGGSGAVTLVGGAGDDMLVARGAGSRLSGGAGRDIFVLAAAEGVLRIEDFRPGSDQLDLSLIPGLRSPLQLQVTPRSDGLRLDFGLTGIVITSATGAPLDLYDLWPEGRFICPDRIAPGVFVEDGITYGSAAADLLLGQEGADQIQGLGGADEIRALGGDDQAWGGTGADSLFGGAGADSLFGGSGADHIEGGSGADRIWGNEGADEIWGADGGDRIYGGSGGDSLSGGSGWDRIWGKTGADQIQGNGGKDRLWGGSGSDSLSGGAGADRLWGNGGKDEIQGEDGGDKIYGGGGGDTLSGGGGADLLQGGRGNDEMRGDGGADVFVFGQGHGKDRILDFTPGEDLIDLRGLAAPGFGYEALAIRSSGADCVIQTGSGKITLSGLAPDEIGADDFLF